MFLHSWSSDSIVGNRKANVLPVPVGDNKMMFSVEEIANTASSCIGFKTSIFNLAKMAFWDFMKFDMQIFFLQR